MKHTVSSWFKVFHDHETLFHPDSMCFMTMFHPDSTCFMAFHDHETNCFIANSSWFNMFHHCFIALIHPVSCWFNLFHHCFITVSSLFHRCFITVSPVGTSLNTSTVFKNVHRDEYRWNLKWKKPATGMTLGSWWAKHRLYTFKMFKRTTLILTATMKSVWSLTKLQWPLVSFSAEISKWF